MQRISTLRISERSRPALEAGWSAQGAGFTLVEVLVTLFVIAVIAGIAVIRLGEQDQQEVIRQEARRFAHLLELAREEAVLQGEEWGLVLTARRYHFMRLDENENRWLAVLRKPFAAHQLPAPLSLRLALADQGRIGGHDTTAVTRERAGQQPALLLLSSGEMTPFTLRVLNPDTESVQTLQSDGFGPVRPGQEPGP